MIALDSTLFAPPANTDQKIWRYVKLPQLFSLLYNRSLFCTIARAFSDKFEGATPVGNLAYYKADYVEQIKKMPFNNDDDLEFVEQSVLRQVARYRDFLQYGFGINCWHMNDAESAAMWSLYSREDEGIAIQSTYNRLAKSLQANDSTYIGVVNYMDYATSKVENLNRVSLLLNKRLSYAHEKELRIITQIDSNFELIINAHGDIKPIMSQFLPGINLPVQIEELIENIYVSPTAPKWFTEVVQAVVSREGFPIKIKQSELSADSLY